MTTSTRRWLAAAAVAAGLVTLTACNGEGENPPTTAETTATEPTIEPSEDVTSEGPTATPPEVEAPDAPPEMEIDDTVGASAAVWYFLKLYDYMRATGDTAVWEALSSSECEWCMTVLQETETLHSEGGWVETSGLEFDIASSRVRLPDDENAFYTVILPVTEPAFVVVSGDGTRTENAGYTLDPMGVAVSYESGGFTVVGVNYEVG